MLKALWFMIKVGLLVAIVIWVAERPGFVKIEWMDYTFTVHVGLFLVGALGVILAAIFLYNTIKTFVDFPSSYKRYREIKDQSKGYEALTIGLSAVAAGDTKVAVKQAKRAAKYMSGDTGLPLLLQAQAARLNGDEAAALESFAVLLEDKNAAFLGVRGLLQAALDREDYSKALELAQHALSLHPKQPWIIRIAYDVHIRLREWNDAFDMVRRAEKTKTLTKDEARSERVAILIAQADELSALGDNDAALQKLKAAFKLDAGFAPTATRLSRLYLETAQRKKGVSIIKSAWKVAPHPNLAHVWGMLMSSKRAGEALGRMRWYEKLLRVKSDTSAAQMLIGQIAIEEKLWGEARTHLMQAVELKPCAATYRLLAELERLSGHGEPAAEKWTAQVADGAPQPVWICRETGRIYEEWSPIAAPHGSFNSIEWRAPDSANGDHAAVGMSSGPDRVLEAPIAS